MPRIQTFTNDQAISGTERLLATDSNNDTVNIVISDLLTFINSNNTFPNIPAGTVLGNPVTATGSAAPVPLNSVALIDILEQSPADVLTLINAAVGNPDWQTGGTDDQNASEVPLSTILGLTSTDVQAAIAELLGLIGTAITSTAQITNEGADNTSTYVEADELATVATSNDYNDLDNLPAAGADDQTASEVPFTPTGDVESTNVQNAIAELDSEKEPSLSNPLANGEVLQSTVAGVRSWIAVASAAQGALADSALQSVVQGTNVTIDNTDPQNPIINVSGSTNVLFFDDFSLFPATGLVDTLYIDKDADAEIYYWNGTAYVLLHYRPAVVDLLLGSKADLVGGVVPSNQLPSFVDDVLEFADLASFPATGEAGKIYIAQDTNFTYRWGGTMYVEVSGTTPTVWGGITGTLSAQSDLQTILDSKVESVVAGTNINIDNTDPLNPIITALGAGTGLELITEGLNSGWRLVGKDPANYGNIGANAVDLSQNFGASSTAGATGSNSFAVGASATASGNGAIAMMQGADATSSFCIAMGLNAQASDIGTLAIGGSGVQANSDYAVAVGGQNNIVNNNHSTIVGGLNNNITGAIRAVIIGGDNNDNGGDQAAILAGQLNTVAVGKTGAVILGGSVNNANEAFTLVQGRSNTAHSTNEIVLGYFGTDYTPVAATSYNDADRLLNIGITKDYADANYGASGDTTTSVVTDTTLLNGATGQIQYHKHGNIVHVVMRINLASVPSVSNRAMYQMPAGFIPEIGSANQRILGHAQNIVYGGAPDSDRMEVVLATSGAIELQAISATGKNYFFQFLYIEG